MQFDYERRWSRTIAAMSLASVDALVVTRLPNIRYLTGFSGSSGAVVINSEGTLLLTDFRYEAQLSSEVHPSVRTEIIGSDFWKKVAARVRGSAVAIEDSISCDTRSELEAALGGDVVTTKGLVDAIRETKEEAEVELLRQAAQLASTVFEEVVATVKVGESEVAVAARLEYELRIKGSEWHPFTTIVASGPRSALPHARSGEREIGSGDLLLFDFGAIVDGYCSDITRVAVVGRAPDERQRRIHEIVREAQKTAISSMRAGMSGRDVDQLARGVIERSGFGSEFGHSLGHGLGLDVHEGPRIAKSNEKPLPVGCVVTIEPGIYVPGWGGVRLEDDVYLGADSAQLLSDGNVDLFQV